jgi:hypothetical protein
MSDRSALQTESGSFEGLDMDATVIDAWFAPREGANDRVFLHTLLKVNSVEEATPMPPFVEEEIEASGGIDHTLSVGNGWFTEDRVTISHPDGGNKKIHAMTNLGMIVDTLTGRLEGYGKTSTQVDTDEAPVTDMTGAIDAIDEAGNPLDARDARFLVGCRFNWRRVRFQGGTDKEGKEIVYVKSLPVKFLGFEAQGAAAATPAAAAGQAATVAAITGDGPAAGGDALDALFNGADTAVVAAVREALVSSDDFVTFLNAVTPKVASAGTDVLGKVTDQNGGAWALRDVVTAS